MTIETVVKINCNYCEHKIETQFLHEVVITLADNPIQYAVNFGERPTLHLHFHESCWLDITAQKLAEMIGKYEYRNVAQVVEDAQNARTAK